MIARHFSAPHNSAPDRRQMDFNRFLHFFANPDVFRWTSSLKSTVILMRFFGLRGFPSSWSTTRRLSASYRGQAATIRLAESIG
jgi:hypothetical protein